MPRRRSPPRKNSRSDHLPVIEGWSWGLIRTAPLGTYEIDMAVEECVHAGIFPPIQLDVRVTATMTAYGAVSAAERDFKLLPDYRRLTKRFLGDLKLIDHLIERNRDLDPLVQLTVLWSRPGPARETYKQAGITTTDAMSRLQDALRAVSVEISKLFGSSPCAPRAWGKPRSASGGIYK